MRKRLHIITQMNSALPAPARAARATVKSLSQAAGVSASTVSRALRGDTRISTRTRKRILKLAQSVHYVPNQMARGLSTRRSGMVALLLGEVTNPFYPEFLQCLTAKTAQRGLQLLLLPLGSIRLEAEMIRTMVEYGVDGCLVAAAALTDEAFDAIAAFKVPAVMINRSGGGRTSAVLCNNQAGGATIGRFLVERGHRRIAYAAGRQTISEREQGLRAALSEAGLQLAVREVGTYSHESGVDMAQRILARNRKLHAIVGANDIIALGVIDGARKLGIAVPEQLSVIGFDDIGPSNWLSYSLTTVRQPTPAMIDRALDLLQARIADPALAPEEVLMPGELSVRTSVLDLGRSVRQGGGQR